MIRINPIFNERLMQLKARHNAIKAALIERLKERLNPQAKAVLERFKAIWKQAKAADPRLRELAHACQGLSLSEMVTIKIERANADE